MDRILVSLQDNQPLTSDEIARTAASAGRRDRNRTRLRLVYFAAGESLPHPENAIAARQELEIAKSKLCGNEWSILRHVAEGYSYGELASSVGGTPERLRVRVLRSRRKLAMAA
jgi:DNA-binding CsgD family transcriptional regulator